MIHNDTLVDTGLADCAHKKGSEYFLGRIGERLQL